MPYYVYITINKPRGVLYIGVTNDTISHSIGGYSGLLRFARNDGNWRHCEELKATKQPIFVCHLIDKWYDIVRRIYEHKNGLIKGFTKKYNLKKVVYVESYGQVNEAIHREKQLKNWHRDWKINQIESVNPKWVELNTAL